MSNRVRHFRLFHAENDHDGVAKDKITEKGTERSKKVLLDLKIIQIHMVISYLPVKNF